MRADGSAAIAYELGSAHWGLGLARRATEAMLAELIEHYGVTTLFAVAKERNHRSLRLLGRLGFVIAGSDLRARRGVDPTRRCWCAARSGRKAPACRPSLRSPDPKRERSPSGGPCNVP